MRVKDNAQSGKRLGLYAGIRESEKGFLYPEKFIKFYDEMGDFVSEAKGKERKKLHELQTAFRIGRCFLALCSNRTAIFWIPGIPD